MSIKNHVTGEEKYAGCVIETYEHYWLDGMLEVIAVCWNNETKTTDHVTVEYLGSDCRNMMDTTANVDLTTENARNFIRCHKMDALNSFAKSVQEVKQKIHKDDVCRVVRGRKVKKGTILTVFWCGEKPTYFAQTHRFVNEKELICGCFDESGISGKAPALYPEVSLGKREEKVSESVYGRQLSRRFKNCLRIKSPLANCPHICYNTGMRTILKSVDLSV